MNIGQHTPSRIHSNNTEDQYQAGRLSIYMSVALGMSRISLVPVDVGVAAALLVRRVPEDDEEEEDDDQRHGDDEEEDDEQGEGYSE